MKKKVDMKKIKEYHDLDMTVLDRLFAKEEIMVGLFEQILSCVTLGLYLADSQVDRIRDVYKLRKEKFLLEQKWIQGGQEKRCGQDGAEAAREKSLYCNLFYLELILFGEHNKEFYNRYFTICKENCFDAFDMSDNTEYFYFIDLAVMALNYNELQFASETIKALNNKKKTKLGLIIDSYCEALISSDVSLLSIVKKDYLKHLNRVKDPSDLLLGQNYDYYYLHHFKMNENGSVMEMLTHAIENEYALKS